MCSFRRSQWADEYSKASLIWSLKIDIKVVGSAKIRKEG